jgi:multidrug resistance efflux pump
MIAFLSLCYGAFYWLFFVKLKLFAKSARNISIFVGIGVVFIGTIVFMWLTFAPTSPDARMFQYVIQIVPNVKGTVVEVPVVPLDLVEKGEILFKIDPTPYQTAVDQARAAIDQAEVQLRLDQLEVDRVTELVGKSAAAQRELDQWNTRLVADKANIESLTAQLANAQWQLDQTVVKAPNDGYVFNLQVRPGTYVASLPISAALTFVSEEVRQVIASLSQSSARYVRPGDVAEVVFNERPGKVYAGTVTAIAKATGTAQLAPSGELPVFTGDPTHGRYPLRIELTDPESDQVSQGAGGTVAVYTQRGKPFHIITKVVMRMQAWLAYLTSP